MRDTHTHAPEEYLTPAEVTDLLKISRSTLLRYCSSGRIKAYRLPSGHRRFLRSDIDALLAAS